jgi:hypothetical protein
MIEITIIISVIIPYIYIKIKNKFFYKLKKYNKLDRSVL